MITGRVYLDPGDRWSGRIDPPRRVTIVTPCRFGRGCGPRNVAVRLEDGTVVVVPFSRRLRRAPAE